MNTTSKCLISNIRSTLSSRQLCFSKRKPKERQKAKLGRRTTRKMIEVLVNLSQMRVSRLKLTMKTMSVSSSMIPTTP